MKTSGRLLSGFVRKLTDSHFHGGTIFNDASVGIISVENKISLGAGETVMINQQFEERL